MYLTSNQIRIVRKLHGLSQRELARLINVDSGLISKVEADKASVSTNLNKRLIDALEITEEKLALAIEVSERFKVRTPIA
ncbi:hypothetical protein BACCIP111899_01584 [Bacillus rhizoplanae]|uniref:HTH cro/C1-type domain-containing protein n=1 Tax=Bacillus rhizoplanae TaxID=2880966 RepID=A0ABM8Y9H1_9BACI|nr:helix-turn-helix transcriptional regulator [Bacillus rhizoplanae]CAG9612408.1 hypothetical protein BACCIP111899_01584 [Bacillus rhizoplanae]